MNCQACQTAKATIHETERLAGGGHREAHYCESCLRLKQSSNCLGARKPGHYCGRCDKQVTGRELSCPHCGQSFADAARCPACNMVGILPLDRSIWDRYRKNTIDRQEALSRGFMCKACGYQWTPGTVT
jgi:hypothetical protein